MKESGISCKVESCMAKYIHWARKASAFMSITVVKAWCAKLQSVHSCQTHSQGAHVFELSIAASTAWQDSHQPDYWSSVSLCESLTASQRADSLESRLLA